MASNMMDEEELQSDTMTWQEYLIECVRCRPCLYSKYDKEYQDTRGVKENGWQEVAELMVAAGFTNIKGKPTSNNLLLLSLL